MAGQGVVECRIEAYLTAVSAQLVGPRAACTAILDELRDGLHEATTCHRDRGVSPEAAIAAALREFGPPAALAASFAGELATSRARRISCAYLLTGPLVGSAWLLMLAPASWWRLGPRAVWTAIPVAPMVAVAVTICAVVLFASGRPHERLGRLVGHGLHAAMIVIGSAILGDLVMLIVAIHSTAAMAASPTLAVIAVSASAARLCCSLPAGQRCARSRRNLTSR